MKKIVELENKWRTYRYRMFMFYIFLFVLFIFLVFFGFFIKLQYDKYSYNRSAKESIHNGNKKEVSIVQKKVVTPSNNRVTTVDRVNFICRKVIVDKLTVRASDSFSSKPLGFYPQNSIFCADSMMSNGLLKTQNGWVGSSLKYSKQITTNMFVDFGFNKYNLKSLSNKKTVKLASHNTPANEMKVFENNVSLKKDTKDIVNDNVYTETVKSNIKPIINITSEFVTPEKNIELLKDDFNKNNDYDTAIKIATFYYDSKDYKDAIKWALNASRADSKDKQKSDSWIIYSKSLYLSGDKEKAISVLERYVSATNSKYVRDILNNMKKGVI